MILKFIGQGFDDVSVGQHLIDAILTKNYQELHIISAFASKSGVLGLKNIVEKLESIHVVVGIDQKGTSKEALEELLTLPEKSVKIYHSTSSIIFHPKIYWFIGEQKHTLIVGSSNLTTQGLFQNIEAALLIEIKTGTDEEIKITNEINRFYENLKQNSNLQILSKQLIDNLVNSKIVP